LIFCIEHYVEMWRFHFQMKSLGSKKSLPQIRMTNKIILKCSDD